MSIQINGYNIKEIYYGSIKIGEAYNGSIKVFSGTRRTILNVADYSYTTDANDNVTLTGYTGSDTVVVVPTLEMG